MSCSRELNSTAGLLLSLNSQTQSLVSLHFAASRGQEAKKGNAYQQAFLICSVSLPGQTSKSWGGSDERSPFKDILKEEDRPSGVNTSLQEFGKEAEVIPWKRRQNEEKGRSR